MNLNVMGAHKKNSVMPYNSPMPYLLGIGNAGGIACCYGLKQLNKSFDDDSDEESLTDEEVSPVISTQQTTSFSGAAQEFLSRRKFELGVATLFTGCAAFLTRNYSPQELMAYIAPQ